jgi:hypothetical protein
MPSQLRAATWSSPPLRLRFGARALGVTTTVSFRLWLAYHRVPSPRHAGVIFRLRDTGADGVFNESR